MVEVGDASDEDSIRYMERQLCQTEEQKKELTPLIRLAVKELTNGRPALVKHVVTQVRRGASYTGTCGPVGFNVAEYGDTFDCVWFLLVVRWTEIKQQAMADAETVVTRMGTTVKDVLIEKGAGDAYKMDSPPELEVAKKLLVSPGHIISKKELEEVVYKSIGKRLTSVKEAITDGNMFAAHQDGSVTFQSRAMQTYLRQYLQQ